MKPKLVLGLSGGVDSAVSARLLMEDYEVTGLYLSIGPDAKGEADAAAVAETLGIDFRTLNIAEALEKHVKAQFAADYLSGRTPLPCARCNPLVKFPALLSVADEIGAEFVATGHYARTGRSPEGRALLRKGLSSKDQSYLLSRLPQEILKRIIFPLGEFEKGHVRELAEGFGIPVAHKPDSMELCFVPDNHYPEWLEQRQVMPPPGNFISPDGEILGRHKGIHHYTLGQGRGLGISGPHRYYVSGIDPEHNTVTLSDGSDLMADTVLLSDPNWIAIPGIDGPTVVNAKFRHTKQETECTLLPQPDGTILAQCHTPVRAPAPGQLAAFYSRDDGDSVLGSCWIEGRIDL